MKDIELCSKCVYGRIIVKDNQIYGRTCEFPVSKFIQNNCYDFIDRESSIIEIG